MKYDHPPVPNNRSLGTLKEIDSQTTQTACWSTRSAKASRSAWNKQTASATNGDSNSENESTVYADYSAVRYSLCNPLTKDT